MNKSKFYLQLLENFHKQLIMKMTVWTDSRNIEYSSSESIVLLKFLMNSIVWVWINLLKWTVWTDSHNKN